MKRFTFILAAFIIGVGIYSCSSDDGGSNPDPSKSQASDWTVFKNQTGDPAANALQAQYHNQNGTLNIYGTFDQNNDPYRIYTLTYQKTDNDTLVNMVVDPLYNRVNTIFFTVNGTKQPAVAKFDYTGNNTAGVSYYNYDWSAKTAEMLYSCNIEIPVVQGFNAAFAPNKTVLSINWAALGVLGASVAITEGIILAAGGETVIIAALGTVAAAPIVTTIATIGITVGIAAAALAVIIGDANATEPVDRPYPDEIPTQNPVSEEENPDNNLPVSECAENALVYNVFMDFEGTIVIETPTSGGTGPYSYFLEGQSGFADIGIYANDYPNGEYTVAVKDAEGCITIKSVELSRSCTGSDLAVTATASGDSATAAATGGTPPYNYVWSNGATGETATGLADGTYTVTVTDDNGCNATASVVVEEYSYQLQIGDYNPDYSLITPLQTISQGGSVTFPNYLEQMARLLLNGEPVNVGQYGLPWTPIPFGSVPVSEASIYEPDYTFDIYDYTNNRNVTFHLDLTLTNQGYAQLVGNTLKMGGRLVTFNSDGTCTSVWQDTGESAGTPNSYSWALVRAYNYINNCPSLNSAIPLNGAIHTQGDAIIPDYVLIEQGGGFRASSFYGCPDSGSYKPIE